MSEQQSADFDEFLDEMQTLMDFIKSDIIKEYQ